MRKQFLALLFFGIPLVLTQSLKADELEVRAVDFLDTSAPVCEVGNSVPDVLPQCGDEDVGLANLCANLGCPEIDLVDVGPISGDLNGEITVCINLPDTPPDGNSFISVSGCVLIVENEGTEWRGPFTAAFNLFTYGAFGDYFVRTESGSSLRATFTQLTPPGEPPVFINHGLLTEIGGEDDDD